MRAVSAVQAGATGASETKHPPLDIILNKFITTCIRRTSSYNVFSFPGRNFSNIIVSFILSVVSAEFSFVENERLFP